MQQQYTFPTESIEPIVMPARIYEMSFDEFMTSDHVVEFTNRDVHDGNAVSERLYVNEDVIMAYNQIHDTTNIKKSKILSNMMKLGLCVWQRENGDIYKKMVKRRSDLYETNYELCKKIFGSSNKSRADQVGRVDLNVLCDVNETSAVITNYANALGLSKSLIGGVFLTIGFLRWDGLAPAARKTLESEVAECVKRRDYIAKLCEENPQK